MLQLLFLDDLTLIKIKLITFKSSLKFCFMTFISLMDEKRWLGGSGTLHNANKISVDPTSRPN